MYFDWKKIGAGIGVVLLLSIVLWFFFFRADAPLVSVIPTPNFGGGVDVSNTPTNNPTNPATTTNVAPQSQQKIFKIANGPIASAVFVQTSRPTTTIARYVMQDSGHVLDQAISTSSASSRPASNTTIPAVASVVWAEQGGAALFHYIDDEVVKTVYVGLPPATTSLSAAQLPIRVQFLPNNILSLASSPDGKNIVYLLKTLGGVDGYIATPSGTNSRKVFSLPLSQLILSWPSQNTILAQTKSAVGVPGVLFSINSTSGTVSQVVYAAGLTTVANSTFSKILYQTAPNDAIHLSYIRDNASGKNILLSFQPFPEKCVWAPQPLSVAYCAVPFQYTPQNYLDLWHQGAIRTTDSLISFSGTSGKSTIITIPGGTDGGTSADIEQLAISPDGNYLLYVTRGDRSLWGVRLSN